MIVLTRFAGIRLSRPFFTTWSSGISVRSQEADVFDSVFLRSLSGTDREPEAPLSSEVINFFLKFPMRSSPN